MPGVVDPFPFYTPVGTQTDGDGINYFDVPADEISIERDDTLNKSIEISVTKESGIVSTETYEGAEGENIKIGLEGDIILYGNIPTDLQEEIVLTYKEVTDGTL